MDWTDETIARLGALWAEGHSTAEIGRRLGITKNAVVGKAHRLRLKPRPSPIRRPSERASVLPVEAPSDFTDAALPAETPAPRPAPARPRPEFQAVAAPRIGPRTTPCCWPIGEPGTAAFRFCDAVAATGKPYCQDHVSLAYVKVRDRREEAA